MGQLGRNKTMRVTILTLARNDLRDIRKHLSDYGSIPPKRFRASFEEFCIQVADMPYMFGVYENKPKYRRAVIIYGYLVFYQVDEKMNTVKVFRVLHGKRNVEPLLDR